MEGRLTPEEMDQERKVKALLETEWAPLDRETLLTDKKKFDKRIDSHIAKLNWQSLLTVLEKNKKEKNHENVEALDAKITSIGRDIDALKRVQTLTSIFTNALSLASFHESDASMAAKQINYKQLYVKYVNETIEELININGFTRDYNMKDVTGRKTFWSKIHPGYAADMVAKQGIILETSLAGSLFNGLTWGTTWSPDLNKPMGYFWDRMSSEIANAYTKDTIVEARVLEHPVPNTIFVDVEWPKILEKIKNGSLTALELIKLEFQDTKDRNIFLLSKLPDLEDENIKRKYEDSYIFVKDEDHEVLNLFFIENGKSIPLPLTSGIDELNLKDVNVPKLVDGEKDALKEREYQDILDRIRTKKKELIDKKNQNVGILLHSPESEEAINNDTDKKRILAARALIRREGHPLAPALVDKSAIDTSKRVLIKTDEAFKAEVQDASAEYNEHQRHWQGYQKAREKTKEWFRSMVNLHNKGKLVEARNKLLTSPIPTPKSRQIPERVLTRSKSMLDKSRTPTPRTPQTPQTPSDLSRENSERNLSLTGLPQFNTNLFKNKSSSEIQSRPSDASSKKTLISPTPETPSLPTATNLISPPASPPGAKTPSGLSSLPTDDPEREAHHSRSAFRRK